MTARFWFIDYPDGQPHAVVVNEYELVTCSAEPGVRRLGNRLGDLAVCVDPRGVKGFTWLGGGEVMILPRVLQLLERNGVTGFETRPVKVSLPDEIELTPPDLYELVVTGWGGLAAPAAGVELVQWCPACGYKKYAIAEPSRLIDASAWDGSDLFVVWPLPKFPFCSDRLANILREEKISGLKLIPAPDIRPKRGSLASPGSLADHMPDPRARELEDRFGVSRWLVEAHASRAR
jgi:hypothetical protein